MTQTTITLSGQTCTHATGPPANSYVCPVGPTPGVAFVLMTRANWDKISSLTSHTLVFDGSRAKVSIRELYLVKAARVLPGEKGDKNALYILELADKRRILEKFTDTAGESYYIRSYANEQPYLTGTFQTSWNSALSDLWGHISSIAGTWPGLPSGYSPAGTPEGLQFAGVNAWAAIHEVLAIIGCTTAYDPLNATFSVVRLGATQTTAALPTPVYDAEPFSGTAVDVPETVRVYFHDHYRSYGQERDTELVTNWAVKPPFTSTDSATGVVGAVVGSVRPIWTNQPRVLDEDNSDDNAAARATFAAQVKTNYLLDAQTPRVLRKYEGVIRTVLPGSQIKAVQWHHWGPDSGTITEFVQHPGLPGRINATNTGISCDFVGLCENVAPPDLGRHTFPNYPRLPNIVKVYDSGEAFGAVVSPNADGLHPATVQRWVAGSMAELDNIWVRFVDDHDTLDGQVDAINGEFYGPARLSGLETSGGDQRAIYLATRGQESRFGPILNAYLTNTTNIAPTANTTLSWTERDKGGTGISLANTIIALQPSTWYEMDISVSFQDQGSPAAVVTDFSMTWTLNAFGVFWQENVYEPTASFAPDSVGYSYKFLTGSGDTTLTIQIINNSATRTLQVNGTTAVPTTYLSISRIP